MKYLALFILGFYVAFSSFAYGRAEQWRPHGVTRPVELSTALGYDLTDIRLLNQVAARKPTNSERAAALRQKQAKTLAKVYGITAGNIDSYKEWR